MLRRMILAACVRPLELYRVAAFLRVYRRAQEALRTDGFPSSQLEVACLQTGADPEWAAAVVEEWMESRPLSLLGPAIYEGVREFLRAAREASVRLALVSDYPAGRKLAALGLESSFDLVCCASDPDIGAFKPSPKGLLRALCRLDVPPEEAVYVGDRPEVDAEAARRANMFAWILARRGGPGGAHWSSFTGFDDLSRKLNLPFRGER
jgi:HAD superfamily hydrolase (TIGR01549 family)